MIKHGAEAWLIRCDKNIEVFKTTMDSLTTADKIDFIRSQYAILSVIRKALKGEVKFQGIHRS